MQAHGVPIAVPLVCSHHVSPNLNTLLFIISSRRLHTNDVGKCSGAYLFRYLLMVDTPSSVQMFVYIEVASVVTI